MSRPENSTRVLILGPRAVAHRIGKQLESQGLSPVFESDLGVELPAPGKPNAIDELRKMLTLFKDRSGSGEPVSHFVHPGTSLWAERPELATVGLELELNVICPPVKALGCFCNKLGLLDRADSLGIPNLVMSFDPIYSRREIDSLIQNHQGKFPLVLKSALGTGRNGVLVIQSPEDLQTRFEIWMEQLRKDYGEVMLFAERYLEGARHITVPFARFRGGKIVWMPMVDSSLQSRYRKMIEICPANGINDAVIDSGIETDLQKWTSLLAEDTHFVGVGELEFLVDGHRAYLVQGLARLNSAYSLWESVGQTDAIRLQLLGLEPKTPSGNLALLQKEQWKWAMSLRVLAEDSMLQLPQPGVVHEVSLPKPIDLPQGQASIELLVKSGDPILPKDEGLLGFVWVCSNQKDDLIGLAQSILDSLWIAGSTQTNERFLREILEHPWVKAGMFHASFIDEEFVPEVRPPAEILMAFSQVCQALESKLKTQNSASSENTRWVVGDQWAKTNVSAYQWSGPDSLIAEAGGTKNLGLRGELFAPDLDERLRVLAYPVTSNRWQVRVGKWVLGVRRVDANQQKDRFHRLYSLVSGKVHAIRFRERSTIAPHEPIVIVESLGALISHALPASVRLLEWKIHPEQEVQCGQEMATFERVIEPSCNSD